MVTGVPEVLVKEKDAVMLSWSGATFTGTTVSLKDNSFLPEARLPHKSSPDRITSRVVMGVSGCFFFFIPGGENAGDEENNCRYEDAGVRHIEGGPAVVEEGDGDVNEVHHVTVHQLGEETVLLLIRNQEALNQAVRQVAGYARQQQDIGQLEPCRVEEVFPVKHDQDHDGEHGNCQKR